MFRFGFLCVLLSYGQSVYIVFLVYFLLSVLCCQHRCKWLPGKTRLRNDLLCVEWDVKLYSFTHFSVAVPQTWNRLLMKLKLLRSTASFRQKTLRHICSAGLMEPRASMFNFVMHHRSNRKGHNINATVTVLFIYIESQCLPHLFRQAVPNS